MRLLYYYHVPVGTTEGGIFVTSGTQGSFVESLAANCDELFLAVHEPGPNDCNLDYEIQARNVRRISLGRHLSVPWRMIAGISAMREVQSLKGKLDCALLRGPSPLLPRMFSALRPVPTAMLIVGDYLDGIDYLPQRKWRKQLIRLWAGWNSRAQWNLARNALVFVNSRRLYEMYHSRAGYMVETRTTSLSRADIHVVEDRCLNTVIRLLYAGRIDSAKGIYELIAAVKHLRDAKREVLLDIVGGCANGDPTLERLRNCTERQQVGPFVTFHGHKPFGEELFEFYRNADIFLLPSYAEGFPRAIWEAMAFSLPVIASRVGSIPHYLSDGGDALLVPPRDSSALVAAVVRLLDQPDLRKRLIARGRDLAGENVLETRTRDLVQELKKYCAVS